MLNLKNSLSPKKKGNNKIDKIYKKTEIQIIEEKSGETLQANSDKSVENTFV